MFNFLRKDGTSQSPSVTAQVKGTQMHVQIGTQNSTVQSLLNKVCITYIPYTFKKIHLNVVYGMFVLKVVNTRVT